ncbi:protein-disulfide reductase DsbD family protein [Roseospira goensis]|uniref:Suppressor for copper-sensitivity B n=1 Tax=Roseospira goensis TaxID=391922 RepID=A0A7W6WJE2_9PROT|nr:protein-disulfide reductase DsbD domain-containing protein [Roseospira goensis]MBB4284402.1 suppressor for copper-sensitivity B [Roseospira goensis]
MTHRSVAGPSARSVAAWTRAGALLVPLMGVLALALGLAALAPGGGARAELPSWTPPGTSAWAETPEGRVRLIAARGALNGESTVRLGLEFDMVDDWKVYWRSPGDAGYPPSIDWSGSANLTDAAMLWPAPERFSVLGIETLGYKDGVVYPLHATVADAGESLRLRADVDYLTCADLCIPRTVSLSLDLPAGPGAPTDHAHAINRAESAVPGDGTAHGLRLDEAAVVGDGTVLRVAVAADPPLTAPDLFVEGPEGSWFDPPTVARDPDSGLAVLWSRVGGLDDLRGVPLTVTVVEGPRGMEAEVTPVAAAAPHPLAALAEAGGTGGGPGVGAGLGGGAPQPPPLDAATLLTMVGLALLGGLILNLMPCVLPVLSLKVLGLVGHGGAAPAHARTSFLMSAAGIVTSFLVLGAAAIAVKAAGVAVGWGIQFQQPAFLVVMIVLLSLFAANLWGLFEVALPGWLAGAASAGATRAGGDDPGSPWGAFGTGAFATLLATPCSAPFLGTAVGFALSRGWAEIGLIFLALGVGMALPYLLIAARPGLATRLPRPGRWMIGLKAVLGLALAGTAVWLVTVLAAQVPPLAAALVAALMAVMVLALAIPRRPLRAGLAGLAALAALALPAWAGLMPGAGGADGRGPDATAPAAGAWRSLDVAAIPGLVAEGRTVFVDVTADWCVTCIVNKRAVLDQDPVAARLAGDDMVLMRGDWTRPDAAIAAYLASFGRYGIPFNAVYGRAAPDGLTLPELLTPGVVLDAIDAAAAPVTAARPES